MATKKKKISPYEDGDSAHWVAAKPKRKRVRPTDANSSAKYTGKGNSKQKITTKR